MACGCGTYTPTGPCNVNAVVCKGYYVDIDPAYAVSSIGAEPLHGTVTILPNGNIRYEHDDSGLAPDSFIYNYSGGFCTISITVQEGIPDNTTVIILTASADCEVGTPTYTWTLPDCAELVEGYTIHDQIIHVIVPVYDPENPDATCEITVDVCCDFCINCCKCETYIWNPPQCVYPCGDDPICECDGPCEVYNPVTGNCDGCPDGLICCGSFGSREEVSLLDITVECAPVYEGDELTDIEFTFTPTLSSGHISDINWYFLDIEGECTPPVEECVNYATQCESAVTLINRFNTEWDRPDYAKIQYGNTHQVFWKPSQALINGVGHDATVIPVTLEYVTGCGNAYKSYYIVVDFENTQESCGVTILTGVIESVEFCDEPATSCLRQDTTNCQECCSDIDCPGNQSCVEGVCGCPEDTVETPLGYCCPLAELIPDCYICNDLGQVIPASDETCGVHEEFDPVTCDCVCVEGYCLDVLTNECVECPPCVVASRFRQRTEGAYQTYIPPACPTCKDCVACTNEPECVSGYMCMKKSCGTKSLCNGDLVDQIENSEPTVPYIHPCTGLEVPCSEEHPCCCRPLPCDTYIDEYPLIVEDNDIEIGSFAPHICHVSTRFGGFIDGLPIDSGVVLWEINPTQSETGWIELTPDGDRKVTVLFSEYGQGFFIRLTYKGRTKTMEYWENTCYNFELLPVYDSCIHIVSSEFGEIVDFTNNCGGSASIVDGEIVIKNNTSTTTNCLCAIVDVDDPVCGNLEFCTSIPACPDVCTKTPFSIDLDVAVLPNGHYLYHANISSVFGAVLTTCSPPTRQEWEDAPKNITTGIVPVYSNTNQDECGTLPNSGFLGCPFVLVENPGEYGEDFFNCISVDNSPQPNAPCGWVVSGVKIHDVNGSNIEIEKLPGQTNKVCFGVNTECGYYCRCELVTPPEEQCDVEGNIDVDCTLVDGNYHATISATSTNNAFFSYTVSKVVLNNFGIPTTTIVQTGSGWNGLDMSINLGSVLPSQVILNVSDAIGCVDEVIDTCESVLCSTLQVSAEVVNCNDDTPTIHITVVGGTPNYTVTISDTNGYCNHQYLNVTPGTLLTKTCTGNPGTILVHVTDTTTPVRCEKDVVLTGCNQDCLWDLQATCGTVGTNSYITYTVNLNGVPYNTISPIILTVEGCQFDIVRILTPGDFSGGIFTETTLCEQPTPPIQVYAVDRNNCTKVVALDNCDDPTPAFCDTIGGGGYVDNPDSGNNKHIYIPYWSNGDTF